MEEVIERIAINVGGKKYETTRTTLDLFPNSFVGMLSRRHPTAPELFIDRDGKLFRWILYWYQTRILVDHNTAGVPLEVWDAELQFYGIGDEELGKYYENIHFKISHYMSSYF